MHPFDDHNFIAGHATIGLEILEDAPDTAAVIAGIGGGGLIVGVGSAIKALRPEIRIWGAEPETAAPAALSFAMGSPQAFKDWTPSFVDGAGGQSVFPRMWERMRPLVDGSIVVSLDETRRAMRLMAEKARVIAEGAGALPLAAALTREGRSGTDRRHRLRRQHRPEEVRRADRRRLDASGDARHGRDQLGRIDRLRDVDEKAGAQGARSDPRSARTRSARSPGPSRPAPGRARALAGAARSRRRPACRCR